ncbi:MAG TPA: recombinase family protein [Thermoleophilaceae bacterium]|nr:recombinase family protein [Thermoleophilaceae bacterium]
MAALVLALLPATGFAKGSDGTTAHRAALVPITESATTVLARGTGYWRPAATQRTIEVEARRVAALQRVLTRLGKRPGPVDGLYGPLTEAGVVRFQRAAGLAADGIVGRHTARRLLEATRTPATQPARNSKPDRSRQAQLASMPRPHAAGLGAGVAQAAAPGQEDELEPELLLAVALPLMLVSVLLGALRGRVTPLRKTKRNDPLHRSTETARPRRLRPTAVAGHSRGEARKKHHDQATVQVIGYIGASEQGAPDLRRQMEAITDACEQRGWHLLQIVQDVEGEDPGTRNRAGLAHTLERLRTGDASCVMVWDLPQLSFALAELGSVLKAIGRSGGRFVSLNDQIDTGEPAGRKAANVIVSVSGWEGQRVGERTRRGLAAARAKGGSISRPSVEDIPRLKDYIAELRASGMTLQAIADTLNEEGVPTLRGGQKWRPSSVQAAVGYRRPKR